VDATVNIQSPLTALLRFLTTPEIDSSNYTTAQMCNFGRRHQWYLAAMQ